MEKTLGIAKSGIKRLLDRVGKLVSGFELFEKPGERPPQQPLSKKGSEREKVDSKTTTASVKGE